MKHLQKLLALLLFFCHFLSFSTHACSEFLFSDDRFRNRMTTENLDAIIDEYELYDGWYWTTPSEITQDFHGHPESPGWTSTVSDAGRRDFLRGWYGCRWPIDHVRKTAPDEGGYAECFGFAQFIGYLLSGDINPQGNWDFFYSLESSDGLKVGDILRVEYKKNGHLIQHSAVVYAVNGEEILFLQVSGGNYNRISVGRGFTDGNLIDARFIEDISTVHGMKISRYIISE